MCVIVPDFAAIAKTVYEIWRFFDFFRMAAAAISDFQNVGIVGFGRVETVKMHHRVKFRGGDRSNRC